MNESGCVQAPSRASSSSSSRASFPCCPSRPVPRSTRCIGGAGPRSTSPMRVSGPFEAQPSTAHATTHRADAAHSLFRKFGEIDPPERRRSEGRFGGLWQFGGVRGVGYARTGVARVARESLRGERGCASEPVAREGEPVEGVGGGGGPEGGEEPGDFRGDRPEILSHDFFFSWAGRKISSAFLSCLRNFEEIWKFPEVSRKDRLDS